MFFVVGNDPTSTQCACRLGRPACFREMNRTRAYKIMPDLLSKYKRTLISCSCEGYIVIDVRRLRRQRSGDTHVLSTARCVYVLFLSLHLSGIVLYMVWMCTGVIVWWRLHKRWVRDSRYVVVICVHFLSPRGVRNRISPIWWVFLLSCNRKQRDEMLARISIRRSYLQNKQRCRITEWVRRPFRALLCFLFRLCSWMGWWRRSFGSHVFVFVFVINWKSFTLDRRPQHNRRSNRWRARLLALPFADNVVPDGKCSGLVGNIESISMVGCRSHVKWVNKLAKISIRFHVKCPTKLIN